ncbi:MAG: hypothetical protein ACRD1N_03870, partial [Terriglobia bacterium]
SEVEVDIILGHRGPQGWPPRLDFLVAVEAKCWKRKSVHGPMPKTNLWGQVKRNRECGYDRVAGIDILCGEPDSDYREAMVASRSFHASETEKLKCEAVKHRFHKYEGYAIFSFGAIDWKDESKAGTLAMIATRAAPPLAPHSEAVEKAVQAVLETCCREFAPPYHFYFRDGRWVATPCFAG